MSDHDQSRRAFLSGALVVSGAAALGGVVWLVDRLAGGSSLEAAATTTSPSIAPLTTLSGPSTTTTTVDTTTTSSSSTTTTSSTTTLPPTRDVRIICRDAWGAAPPTGEFTLHDIDRITIHHPARVITDNSESPEVTRIHQRYHQGSELGWPDIAYHFLIDLDGNVYEGRRWDAVGDTRTSYDPTGHLLVAVKGNFEEQIPTDAQLESLYDMLAWGAERFGISPKEIGGHRDYAATACPGESLYALLQDRTIANAVQARIDTASTQLVDFCGSEANELISAIEAGTA